MHKDVVLQITFVLAKAIEILEKTAYRYNGLVTMCNVCGRSTERHGDDCQLHELFAETDKLKEMMSQ